MKDKIIFIFYYLYIMEQISINPTSRSDPFYRYKMPALSSHITNRGNGTFTTINNIKEIAEELHHPADIIFKFIGYDLATCVNHKKNTIKGAHKTKVIQESIDKYIIEFVMCPKCSIPELSLSVSGKKKKMKCNYTCSACGANDTFIKNNTASIKTLQLIIKDISSGNVWKKHTTADLDAEIDIFADRFSDITHLL